MHSKDPHSVEGSSPTHVNHKQHLVATCRNLRKLTPASVKSALQKAGFAARGFAWVFL
jgi:hypothetical protein